MLETDVRSQKPVFEYRKQYSSIYFIFEYSVAALRLHINKNVISMSLKVTMLSAERIDSILAENSMH